MTALTFTLKKNPTFKVDCSQLTPDKLAGMSLDKILEITLINNLKVIDLFKVSGNNFDNILFKKSTSQLDFIGHKMARGNITIDGDCGDFLGAKMYNGSVICHGNAGDRVGDKMRRGLILIDGSAGDYCGSQMIAGTIGVFEKVGKYAGFGMKRGTILLTKLPKLHATIQDCGTHTLPFLTLLFASFKPLSTLFNNIQSQRMQRFGGDLACGGNGEILLLLT
ncbi:MAG: formylmethanofuran dehydrogenase subunit C [Methylotenera sp.]